MDVKYDEELVKDIQEIFIHKIVPDNFILVIHKYNRNVLTHEDIERLRKSISLRASKDVNYDLLLTMTKYNGWFEVILQVCNDPDVRQDGLAVAFETKRKKLDERLARDHTEKQEMDMELSDVLFTPESNQRTVAMEYQLSANGVFEADQGAVCMSSESRWQDKNSNQLSKDNDSVPTLKENDKPTSFELSGSCETTIHSGKISGSKMTTASFKLTISNDNTSASPSAIKATLTNSGATKAISSGTGVFEPTPASYSVTKSTSSCTGATKASCFGAIEATLVSPDNSYATDAYTKQVSGSDEENIVEDGNGKLKCRVCDVPVTSDYNANEHLQGRKHKKKYEALKDRNNTSSSSCAVKATPTCSRAIEAILVSPDSSHAIDSRCKQASGRDKEYIVKDVNGKLKCSLCDVPLKSHFNATQHLQGSKHKKKHKALKRL